jgi:glycosyltransferase involved in cell wall biosynthesis
VLIVGVPTLGTGRLLPGLAAFGAAQTYARDGEFLQQLRGLGDGVLREMGRTRHDWGRLDLTALSIDRQQKLRADLRACLAIITPGSIPAIIPDPTQGLLAGPLLEAMVDEGFRPSVILPVLNPLAVADSLQKAEASGFSDAILLWLRRIIDAERMTRGLRRSILTEVILKANRGTVLDRIAAELNLSALRVSADVLPLEVLSGDLAGRWTEDDLAAIPSCRGLVREAYVALMQLADNPTDPVAMMTLDTTRIRLDEIEDLALDQRQALSAEVANLQARLVSADTEKRMVREHLADIAQHRDDQRQGLAFVMELNRKLQADAGELRMRFTRYETALDDLTRLEKTLRQSNGVLEASLEERNRERAWLQREIERQQADIDHMVRTLDEVYRSRSWRLAAPVRAAGISARKMRSLARRIVVGMTPGAAQEHEAPKAPPLLIEDKQEATTSVAAPTAGKAEVSQPVVIDTANHFRPRRVLTPLEAPKARLIAFYLPQFHPIPENDAWWGEGFTEWTNVRPAQPMFPGHYQPHEPGELGYYDLCDPDVQRRQIALARLYGVGGFCFYWYWFGGKRLLEKPVAQWLANPDLDFPFCICWANENWTRRWDGAESEILMGQNHSSEDDLAFIAELAPYLRDPRYIRVGGRPLVIVYRPALLPDAAATALRWRRWCRDNGIGEIHLAYVQSFERTDPTTYGFDAAIEFPPNGMGPDRLTDRIADRDPEFTGVVYDWQSYVARSRAYPTEHYRLYPGVFPGWDNTARRKKNGAIFLGNRPDDYGVWLSNAITRTGEDALTPDDRLVFCNAWNEWAEGAHLEPDRRFGHAFLEATRDALDPSAPPRHITLVGHDGHHHGAQLLLLNLARTYRNAGLSVTILLLKGGKLVDTYEAFGKVVILPDPLQRRSEALATLRALRHEEGEVAIANTTVIGHAVPLLREAGYRVVSLVHEMASICTQMKLFGPMLALTGAAHRVVFPAAIVQRQFEALTGVPVGQAVLQPQGLYLPVPATTPAARSTIRTELGFPPDMPVVMGSGYIDFRKGADLFVRALAALQARGVAATGFWLGHAEEETLARLRTLAADFGVTDALMLLGRVQDPERYYAAADVFLLTSREDPYPSVVLEAMAAELPVVMFSDCTGSEDLAAEGLAVAVPREDAAAMADAVIGLLGDPARRTAMVERAARHIAEKTRFVDYAFALPALAGRPLPRVSVVIPNYNYARYIAARLESVLAQDFPVYEIILLDDCSTDDSAKVIADLLRNCPVPVRFVPNDRNSGNVFRQWQKALDLACGDHVWIAEADDLAEPDFLSTVMRGFEVPGVVLSYCDSAQIDSDGNRTAPDYRYYTNPVCPGKWDDNHIARGAEEIATALFLKNTIPNVSAVVLHRDTARAVFADHGAEIEALSFAGDWAFYIRMLERGDIAYLGPSRNLHRRHASSVTIANFNRRQLDEIAAVQAATITRHGLGEEHRARAAAYIAELARQFGLAEDGKPTLDQHD